MFDLKIIELFGYPNAIQKPNCFSDSNNSWKSTCENEKLIFSKSLLIEPIWNNIQKAMFHLNGWNSMIKK
jgi:hypothetical protein